MNRREFCLGTLAVTAGCSAGDNEMPQEYEIQASPTRTGDRAHSDVPGYAFGVWTPNVGGTATYSTQVGNYFQLGEFIFIYGRMTIGLIGTGDTSLLQGLPFIPIDDAVISVSRATNLATAVVSVTGTIQSGFPKIRFYSRVAADVADNVNAILGDSANVEFSGFYRKSL